MLSETPKINTIKIYCGYVLNFKTHIKIVKVKKNIEKTKETSFLHKENGLCFSIIQLKSHHVITANYYG